MKVTWSNIASAAMNATTKQLDSDEVVEGAAALQSTLYLVS